LYRLISDRDFKMRIGKLFFLLAWTATAVNAAEIAFDSFTYADGMVLSNGPANGGRGWTGSWGVLSGDGLAIMNRQIDQTGGTHSSTRELTNRFSLDGSDMYFSFVARTDAAGSFSFNLKQTSPGPYVRWAFSRNADGSVTVNGGGAFASSAAGVFAADTEYLVVSRFKTAGDIGCFKLFNTSDPRDYTNEPAVWDVTVDGNSGVTIDHLDIEVSAGHVLLDDVRIGSSYADVAVLPEILELIEPSAGGETFCPNPHFDWVHDGVSEEYEIEIATDHEFLNVVDRDVIHCFVHRYVPSGNGSPGDPYEFGLAPGTHWWRVRGIEANGTMNLWTDPQVLTITDPNALYTVDIAAGASWADIQNAVVLAKSNTPARIRFTANAIYRLDPSLDSASHHAYTGAYGTCIDLTGTQNILIDGNNALLRLNARGRRDSFFYIRDSTNIVIRNLQIDYSTNRYYGALVIESVDHLGGTIDARIPDSYPPYSVVPEVYQTIKHNPPIIAPDGFYKYAQQIIITNPPVVLSDRVLRYPVSSNIEYVAPGDAFMVKYGASDMIRSYRNEDVTLNDITIIQMGGCLVAGSTCNKLKILNVRSRPREHGYYHGESVCFVNSGTVGHWVEKTDFAYNTDDFLHTLGARKLDLIRIDAADRRKLTVDTRKAYDAVEYEHGPGELIEFYDSAVPGIVFASRLVSSVNGSSYTELALTDPLPISMVLDPGDPYRYSAFNKDRCCPRFVYRNNESHCSRSTVILGNYIGALIENNRIVGCNEDAFGMSGTGSTGLYTENVMIRNNTVLDGDHVYSGGDSTWIVGGGVKINGFGRANKNIRVVNNFFENAGDRVFFIQYCQDVVVEGNTVLNGKANAIKSFMGDYKSLIHLYNTDRVYFRDNRFIERRTRFTNQLSVSRSSSFWADNPDMNHQFETNNTWQSQEVGPSVNGSVTFGDYSKPDRSLSQIAVQSSGSGIEDGFEYAYLALDGDGGIEAKVESVDSLGGLMMRESLAADAQQVILSGDSGLWIKLTRFGDRFNSYTSADGDRWTRTGTTNVSMNSSILIGLFSAEGTAVFDPVQAEFGLPGYTGWSRIYGLDDPAADEDGDQLKNLYEYGVGGDPTDATDTGYPLQLSVGDTEALFVHPQRSAADSGLRYTVESTENLLSNDWKIVAAEDANINAFVAGFDAVTTRISTEGKDQQFFRLVIEEK